MNESKINIIEVGPRDGFQNVKDFIDTDGKVEIIKKLIDSGLKHVEVTSFVHPKWVPQMKDASDVISGVRDYSKDNDVEMIALVPNKYGAIKAAEVGVDTITYVISASEAHNKANVNKTIVESFQELQEIKSELKDIKIRLGIATVFGCPFNEEVPVDRIISMAKRGLELGVDKIMLADTIGVATPDQVKTILGQVTKEISPDKIVVHLHDTRGLGLANVYVALESGIKNFESAVAGLGGCPFAPGAAGNIATEDLLNMLDSMGYSTGIDMVGLKNTLELVEDNVNADVNSHMSSILLA